MTYWIKNIAIEIGYQKEGTWISGTKTKLMAIKVRQGKFIKIVEMTDFVQEESVPVIDGCQQLILPGLVEKHCHLDKSKIGTPWTPLRPAKTIVERFESEVPLLDALPLSIETRAKTLLAVEMTHGVTKVRSHVDIEPMTDLRYLHAIQSVAETTAIPIELVAFPQHGLMRSKSIPLLEAALKQGVQFIGGVDPYSLDGDYKKSLGETFRLAKKYDVGIDIHLHDRGEAGRKTIREVIRLTQENEWQHRVFISHAFGLNDFSGAERTYIYTLLAQEGIHIVTSVPLTPGVIPPILELKKQGVAINLGCDNINDSWSPYGTGSIQEKLARLGELYEITAQDELTEWLGLITDGQLTLNRQGEKQWPVLGDEATFILTPASCAAEFVARQVPVTTSYVKGACIFNKN